MRFATIGLTLLAALATGCGPTCQTTCAKIYGQVADGNCGRSIPGEDREESYGRCVDTCERGLDIPGELDGYNPNERITSGTIPNLENEKQVAAWMDCVDNTACDLLDDGYCAPL